LDYKPHTYSIQVIDVTFAGFFSSLFVFESLDAIRERYLPSHCLLFLPSFPLVIWRPYFSLFQRVGLLQNTCIVTFKCLQQKSTILNSHLENIIPNEIFFSLTRAVIASANPPPPAAAEADPVPHRRCPAARRGDLRPDHTPAGKGSRGEESSGGPNNENLSLYEKLPASIFFGGGGVLRFTDQGAEQNFSEGGSGVQGRGRGSGGGWGGISSCGGGGGTGRPVTVFGRREGLNRNLRPREGLVQARGFVQHVTGPSIHPPSPASPKCPLLCGLHRASSRDLWQKVRRFALNSSAFFSINKFVAKILCDFFSRIDDLASVPKHILQHFPSDANLHS